MGSGTLVSQVNQIPVVSVLTSVLLLIPTNFSLILSYGTLSANSMENFQDPDIEGSGVAPREHSIVQYLFRRAFSIVVAELLYLHNVLCAVVPLFVVFIHPVLSN